MSFGRHTRYNGNHNNLSLSIGAINTEEREKIRSINIKYNSRPYLMLTYAKMNAPNYVSVEDAISINPNKFKGRDAVPSAKNRTLENLYKHGLIEENPDDPQEFRITRFGIKYLYAKHYFRYRKKTNA